MLLFFVTFLAVCCLVLFTNTLHVPFVSLWLHVIDEIAPNFPIRTEELGTRTFVYLLVDLRVYIVSFDQVENVSAQLFVRTRSWDAGAAVLGRNETRTF